MRGIALTYCAIFFASIALASCAPSAKKRTNTLHKLAYGKGFSPVTLNSSPYKIEAWAKNLGASPTLRIYIEGDGFAWRTPTIPSKDPTPINPLALKLAGEDQAPSVLYLGRPCQYYKAAYCHPGIWTDARFSQAAVTSYLTLLSELTTRFDIRNFELVGYSGGGVMATLIAAQHNNASNLRTVASPMDTSQWIRENKYRPLTGSLNPTMYARKLSTIPQIHYLGSNDKVISQNSITSYLNHLNTATNCAKLEPIHNATHRERIVNQWQKLVKKQPSCSQ